MRGRQGGCVIEATMANEVVIVEGATMAMSQGYNSGRYGRRGNKGAV